MPGAEYYPISCWSGSPWMLLYFRNHYTHWIHSTEIKLEWRQKLLGGKYHQRSHSSVNHESYNTNLLSRMCPVMKWQYNCMGDNRFLIESEVYSTGGYARLSTLSIVRVKSWKVTGCKGDCIMYVYLFLMDMQLNFFYNIYVYAMFSSWDR